MSRGGIEWLDAEALERRHNIGQGGLVILDAVLPNLIAAEPYWRLIEEAGRLGWPSLGIGQRPEENQVYVVTQTAMSDASHTGKLTLTDWRGWMQLGKRELGGELLRRLRRQARRFALSHSTAFARSRVSLLD